jgi:hypothetical protein
MVVWSIALSLWQDTMSWGSMRWNVCSPHSSQEAKREMGPNTPKVTLPATHILYEAPPPKGSTSSQ